MYVCVLCVCVCVRVVCVCVLCVCGVCVSVCVRVVCVYVRVCVCVCVRVVCLCVCVCYSSHSHTLQLGTEISNKCDCGLDPHCNLGLINGPYIEEAIVYVVTSTPQVPVGLHHKNISPTVLGKSLQ